MKINKNGVVIECVTGDIADQSDMDAVVNAANAHLMPGGGVAGAIHRGAGPELAKACKPLAPIKPGEAVITKAFDLPNEYVIHCLGPVYGVDKPEAELLKQCYTNALRLAEENDITCIAFPAISTGAFGYPFKEATNITIQTVLSHTSNVDKVKHLRFVLFQEKDANVYQQILSSNM